MNICQRVVENGFALNIAVLNSLIDMYAKCEAIHKSQYLFYKMHDVIFILDVCKSKCYGRNIVEHI